MKLENYKVAICGAHSQGKTTLVNELQESVYLSSELNFSFRTNLTRNIGKLLPINEAGSTASQYLIMARHLEFALTPGRWIMDRGALDGIVYSQYFYEKGEVDANVMQAIEKVYELCIPHYNKIFYIVPELPLKNDGVRSVNKDFFDGVVEKFNFWTNHFSIHNKVILLTGSPKERAKRVEDEIRKDFTNA